VSGRIVRTPRAEEDLLDIWGYIAQDSPAAADRLLDRIDRALAVLADFPRLGPLREDIGIGACYHVVGRYLIFYRDIGDGIEVVRVVHGMRNLSGLLD
jgi:toxin ParE1/3/4